MTTQELGRECPGGCGTVLYDREETCCGALMCQAEVFPEAFEPTFRYIPEGWTEP